MEFEVNDYSPEQQDELAEDVNESYYGRHKNFDDQRVMDDEDEFSNLLQHQDSNTMA